MNHFFGNALIRYEDGVRNFNKSKTDPLMCDNLIKIACFDLQQAIEFYLKGIILFQGNNYCENHDLRAQLNRLDNIPELNDTLEKIRENASTFNEWENKSRYDFNFVATVEDIKEAIEICKKLREYAEKLIKTEDEENQ